MYIMGAPSISGRGMTGARIKTRGNMDGAALRKVREETPLPAPSHPVSKLPY